LGLCQKAIASFKGQFLGSIIKPFGSTLKRVEEFVEGREAPEQELLEALSSLEALSKLLID